MRVRQHMARVGPIDPLPSPLGLEVLVSASHDPVGLESNRLGYRFHEMVLHMFHLSTSLSSKSTFH